MAAGPELLDDVFFNAEVDEKTVSDVVGSLESQLVGAGPGKLAGRLQTAGGHIGGSAGGNIGEIRDNNNMGLGQENQRAGARVPAGGINDARVQPKGVDAGAVMPGNLKPGLGAPSAASTANHMPGSGQRGTSAVAALNGSNVVVNSHGSVGVGPFSSASSALSPVSSIVSTGTVVNNGPGCMPKGQTTPSGTVIQTSLMNTATVISAQTSCLTAGPTVALVRPPMQTQVTVTAPNGTGSLALSGGVNAVHLPTSNTPGALSLSSTGQVNKADSAKTLIQTVVQTPASVAQPIRGHIMQSGSRTPVPAAVGANPGGIRAIAPQVLAPRVPQPQQSQPSVHNIQLPPGMVLVRSESGQLLMIHQQTLAQMQAQSQGAMATRPTTPTSTPPVHITSVQAPGTPLITRQVAPTTIIKQASPVPAAVQPTTALQRPPLLQNTIMLGGTTAPPVGTPPPGQVGVAPTQRVTTAGTTPAPATTETLENVKKCKNFLSTLIKLASSGKQSSETAANVKELVKNLLEGKLEAEDFTSRLYKELNSSPQPYLVPFLKRSLPALRQMTPDSEAFIQQSQLQQPSAPPSSTALTAAVLGGSSSAQRPTAPPTTPSTAIAKTSSITSITSTTTPTTTSPHQPVISLSQNAPSKPNLIVQPPQQQLGTLVRGPQVNLAQTPMVTLRPGQARVLSPQTVVKTQTLPSGSMLKTAVSVGNKLLSVSGPQSLPSAVQKTKLKDAGSGSFRDDDDINDVASMAGVNLSEESDRILATNSELVGVVTRSCKDETFLYTSSLQRRILEIGKKYGISEVGSDVINIVSHATQQRLQNLLEKVTQVAQQKNVHYKEDERHEQISDVRAQLKFFEQLDQMEKQKKEEQEREILMKAAKSRSRQEDPEQLRLKQKAKEMQQQELAQMRQRDANLTALAAIGPRKKRKVDTSASGSGPEGVSSVSAGSVAAGSGGSRQFPRQRITRVNLRDLLFCLENERETSHSHLLYKAFLK
ncbi:transcription initiation factor TFIID subunit 4-like [Colossoma macropomum]|uniref:transcription initiation factor TFIID subunit 4-like n=1 Tax=Colossoma macropomum TaxID=42526 RepID=UPI0018646B0C|nr:transcription initiation factor TFIID subunit 4-like [Colossoma macropomum]